DHPVLPSFPTRRSSDLVLLLWQTRGRAQTSLRARVYASGFTLPVAFVQDPTDRTIQYVVQQGGRIRVVRSGTVLPTDFLDLASRSEEHTSELQSLAYLV